MEQAVAVELRRKVRMGKHEFDKAEIEGAAHASFEQARRLEQNSEGDKQTLELPPAAMARAEGRVLLVARLHCGALRPPG